MWIEKLGLAFHLKCFKCSVCNIALGNGKEGTDVRVSGANRLHCNNCFSNDLGNICFNLVTLNEWSYFKSKSNTQLKSKFLFDKYSLLPNYSKTKIDFE